MLDNVDSQCCKHYQFTKWFFIQILIIHEDNSLYKFYDAEYIKSGRIRSELGWQNLYTYPWLHYTKHDILLSYASFMSLHNFLDDTSYKLVDK